MMCDIILFSFVFILCVLHDLDKLLEHQFLEQLIGLQDLH